MKRTTRLWTSFLAVLFFSLIFNACKKDTSSDTIPQGQQNVSLYLTDDPGFFDNVFIDIRSVSVWVDTCSNGEMDDDDNDDNDHHHGNNGNGNGNGNHDNDDDDWIDNSCKIWQPLGISPGVYDLLTLRNGTDTLLAAGNIPQGKIKFIKIQLGTNNSLVKDSITYPLNLFPGAQSTILIKLKGNEWDQYMPNRLQLWLDFDISRSVIRVRNNEFFLSPFIKFFTVKSTGSISGKITPREAFPVISVFNGQDTAYALPNPGGEFKIRGLKEGVYNVLINASNGYADTTITGIHITNREEVKLRKIELHH